LNGAPTATLSLGDDLSYSTTLGNFTVSQGIFTANNHNLAIPIFVSTGTLTRTVTMGSGTWRLMSDSGIVWNVTATGLTLNANTSTIQLLTLLFNPGGRSFVGGGFTYNNWIWANTASDPTTAPLTISGANTFNDFTVVAGTGPRSIKWPHGVTNTFTTLELNGVSGDTLGILSDSAGNQATLSVASGTVTGNYLTIQDSAATGGATFNATNSVNVSNNSGWNFQ
jgi:hypothetical protein